MEYESVILKRLIKTYGVVGNPRYISEIIKEFIVRGKERFPELFTYQADWLEHIDEFGLNPSYMVSYTGQSFYAPNTLERPVKRASLTGQTLVNVGDVSNIVNNVSQEISNDGFTTLIHQGNENYKRIAFINNGMLKPNTKYLILFDVKNNSIECDMQLSNSNSLYAFTETGSAYSFPIKAKETGLIKIIRTTKSDLSNITNYLYLTTAFGTIGDGTQSITLRMQMVEYVGGMENWDIPYFEGMKSVQMPVLTTSNEDGTKSNILSTPEDLELHGIGDVKDTLDLTTGELVQNIHETTLNGQNDTSIINNNSLGYINYQGYMSKVVMGKNNEELYLQLVYGEFANSTDYLLKDGFLQFKGYRSTDAESEEGLYRFTGTDHAYLYIKTSRFTDHTLNGVKQFLSENPQTYYVLNKPKSIKTVDLTILDQNGQNVKQLMSFNGGTHFNTGSLEGSLIPSVSVTVETDLEETLKVCSLEGNTM